eukprot:2616982-Prorocentrum_lima.AAC.1
MELRARTSSTRAALGRLARVLHKSSWSLVTKVRVIQALLHTKLFYAAQLWPALRLQQQNMLSSPIMRAYRAALAWPMDRGSDHE